jgi:Zn-dependent M28 family amino/carboxypeptidase
MFSQNRVFRILIVCFTFTAVACATAPVKPKTAFSGTRALAYTRRAVSFGVRPAGSAAIGKLRAWIVSELKPLGAAVSLDSFTARTPAGPVPMANIVAKFPGNGKAALVVTGHYDTKPIPMIQFVGANDAGSSTGFLLELARVIAHTKHQDDVVLVWFDGEEAVGQWSDTDSLYGSRHLQTKWAADGTLSRVKALINVDMIGDKNLDIVNDMNSSQSLRELMLQTADDLGYGTYFLRSGGGIDDDHIPFVSAGTNALDIIDFDYGPNNSYWHTEKDTMDKLSAGSLQVIGDVVVKMLQKLDG